MTAALFSEIEAAPDEPEPPLFDVAETEPESTEPKRTRQRRPRQKKYDDEGNEIKTTRAPRGAKLNDELLESVVSAASDLSAVAPTMAGVLVARAEVTVDGLMALATGRKRTTAVLKKVASVGKISELLTTALLLGVAAAVDFGRIPADSPILDRIGYTDLVRDENGKLKKDDRGFVVKERMTLRDIYTTMNPDAPVSTGPAMPEWSPMNPATGTRPMNVPPMNWVPGA